VKIAKMGGSRHHKQFTFTRKALYTPRFVEKDWGASTVRLTLRRQHVRSSCSIPFHVIHDWKWIDLLVRAFSDKIGRFVTFRCIGQYGRLDQHVIDRHEHYVLNWLAKVCEQRLRVVPRVHERHTFICTARIVGLILRCASTSNRHDYDCCMICQHGDNCRMRCGCVSRVSPSLPSPPSTSSVPYLPITLRVLSAFDTEDGEIIVDVGRALRDIGWGENLIHDILYADSTAIERHDEYGQSSLSPSISNTHLSCDIFADKCPCPCGKRNVIHDDQLSLVRTERGEMAAARIVHASVVDTLIRFRVYLAFESKVRVGDFILSNLMSVYPGNSNPF